MYANLSAIIQKHAVSGSICSPFYFRMPLKIILIAMSAFLIYILKLIKMKITDICFPNNSIIPLRYDNCNLATLLGANAIVSSTPLVVNTLPEVKKSFRNTLAFNPEIINTKNSNMIIVAGIFVGMLLTALIYFNADIASGFLFLSREFMIIQADLMPYFFGNIVNPLMLYYQNDRLRRFAIAYYKDLLF